MKEGTKVKLSRAVADFWGSSTGTITGPDPRGINSNAYAVRLDNVDKTVSVHKNSMEEVQ